MVLFPPLLFGSSAVHVELLTTENWMLGLHLFSANAEEVHMIQESPLRLKVWGDWACFTRPEMKVERVSYPVMTPTAARGVLEAVF